MTHHHDHAAGQHCSAEDNPPPGCPYAELPRIRPDALRIVLFLAVFAGSALLSAGVFDAAGLAGYAAVSGVAGLSVTLLLWKWIDRRPLDALGLTAHRGVPGELLRGALGALWLVSLASLPALVYHGSDLAFFPAGAGAAFRNLAVYGAALFLLGLNEEAAFRGYVLRNLLLMARPWIVVLAGSLVFAAFHATNPNITPIGALNIFLAGAFLSLTVFLWGSLWYAVAFHWVWNLFQGVVLSLPVSGLELGGFIAIPAGGPAWLTGGSFGPEGSVVTSVLLCAASFQVMRAARIDWNKGPEPPACARGEACPALPEEIRDAAARWKESAPSS